MNADNSYDYDKELSDYYELEGKLFEGYVCKECNRRYKTKFIKPTEKPKSGFYDICPYCHHINNERSSGGDIVLMHSRPINIRMED